MRVLRKIAADLILHPLLVTHDQLGPVVGGEIGIEAVSLPLLVVIEQLLEMLVPDTEHDVRIHRDEAAIAVIGEAPVA